MLSLLRQSLREMLADGFQFSPTFWRGLGIGHLQIIERIDNNSGNDQPGVLFIIGGNDVPGCMMGACRAQALLVRLRVMLPEFSFVNVREAEFPILVRLIYTLEEALSLFVLRQVKKDFDDVGAVPVEMFL